MSRHRKRLACVAVKYMRCEGLCKPARNVTVPSHYDAGIEKRAGCAMFALELRASPVNRKAPCNVTTGLELLCTHIVRERQFPSIVLSLFLSMSRRAS